MDFRDDPQGPGASPEISARRARRVATATWGLVALGAALRLRQYFSGRSLWIDEAMLALNVLGRSFTGLLRPLDHHQYAPLGFLFLEKLATTLFGGSENALRLVPLLAGLAALPAFGAMARRVAASDAASLVALALFALCGPLVYYASETKQYSGDVLIAVLLLGAALPRLDEPPTPREAAGLAAAGAAAIWFSHPAVFVLAGIGVVLLAASVRGGDARALGRVLAMGGAWAASFAASWALMLRHGTADRTIGDYWMSAFAPFPPKSFTELRWYLGHLISVFTDPLGFEAASWGIAVLAFLCGALFAFRGRALRLALLLSPVGFALAASASKSYPFDGRFLHFAVPGLLLVVAEGAEWIRHSGRDGGLAALVVGLLFLFPVARATERLERPPTHQELRAVLAAVRPRLLPGDLLYGFRSSPSFDYYLPGFGIARARYVSGLKRQDDWAGYARDLGRLRGKRVWVVFANLSDREAEGAVPFFRYALDALGRPLDVVERPGAAAYLYDLTRVAPP